eukprot:TRINITY_DN9156_c0_g1_i1.p1 TRINITY_DN9156_c0_g1~~TRINITY_DN9156_c0_g1_i1.p1  ORF type:complete len:314 (-),score=24.41 TRINITY_DN9156_c0_g1_i1:1-942(-)
MHSRFFNWFKGKFNETHTKFKKRNYSFTENPFFSGTGLRRPPILKPIVVTVTVSVSAYLIANHFDTTKRKVMNKWSNMIQKRKVSNPQTITEVWDSFPEENKTLSVIVGLNTLVFLGWRFVPELMVKHFLHSPFSGKAYTLLTSVFSHQNPTHFLVNMVALWSFGTSIHKLMGRENFLAFYLSCGMWASLSSHLFHSAMQRFSSSLGASGAVLGLFGYVAYYRPEDRVLLFFVLPIATKYFTPGIVLFDAIGLTGFWSRFFSFSLDHAAHLGGVFTGYMLSNFAINSRGSLRNQPQSRLENLKNNIKQIKDKL